MKKQPKVEVIFEIEGIGPIDDFKLAPSGVDVLAEVFADHFKKGAD